MKTVVFIFGLQFLYSNASDAWLIDINIQFSSWLGFSKIHQDLGNAGGQKIGILNIAGSQW
jgi:hypothetical protein